MTCSTARSLGTVKTNPSRHSAGRVEHKLERPDRAPTLTGRQPLEPDATPVRPGRISAERGKRLSGRRRCSVFFFVAAASVPVLEIDPKVLDRLAAELNSHISERILRVEIGEHMSMGIEKRDRLLTPESRGVDGRIRGTDVNRVHGLDLVTVSRVLRREPLVHRIQKSVQTIVDGGGRVGILSSDDLLRTSASPQVLTPPIQSESAAPDERNVDEARPVCSQLDVLRFELAVGEHRAERPGIAARWQRRRRRGAGAPVAALRPSGAC